MRISAQKEHQGGRKYERTFKYWVWLSDCTSEIVIWRECSHPRSSIQFLPSWVIACNLHLYERDAPCSHCLYGRDATWGCCPHKQGATCTHCPCDAVVLLRGMQHSYHPYDRDAACSYSPCERDAVCSYRSCERVAACSHCPCMQHAVSSLLKRCSMHSLSLWESCFFWGLISQDSWLVYCFSTFAQIIQHHFSQELLCQTLHFWNWIKVFLLVRSGVFVCCLFGFASRSQ